MSSGRRRPNRSDSGPAMIWPAARPRRQAVRVSCATEVDAPSSSVRAGNTGRYKSIEIGPNTVRSSSRTDKAVPTDCLVAGAVLMGRSPIRLAAAVRSVTCGRTGVEPCGLLPGDLHFDVVGQVLEGGEVGGDLTHLGERGHRRGRRVDDGDAVHR